MPASSKAQQSFFGLVRAVQKGEVPASKVTSNVRDAAKDTSSKDADDMAATKTKDLPDRIIPKKGEDDEKETDSKEKKEAAPVGPRRVIKRSPIRSMGDDSLVAELSPETYKSAAGKRDHQARKAYHAQDLGARDKLSQRSKDTTAHAKRQADNQYRHAADNTLRKSKKDWQEDPAHKGRFMNKPNKENEAFGDDPRPYGNPKQRLSKNPEYEKPENQRQVPENSSLGDIVGMYNEYGKALKRDQSLSELAQHLSDIAEYAEYTLTNEMTDWYDKHTISRNVKEMKSYAKEFATIANEADSHNIRMSALYDDMGRVLERYFDIYDSSTGQPDDSMSSGTMSEFTSQPEDRAPAKTLTSPSEEGRKGVFDNRDPMTERAVAHIRGKLRGEQLIKFDKLPESVRSGVAWKAISGPSR